MSQQSIQVCIHPKASGNNSFQIPQILTKISSNWPTIVGEFSLSVPDNVQWNGDWHPDSNKDFYNRWFAAQIIRYERDTNGWIFWSWKTQLGDYRWSYQGMSRLRLLFAI